jgi:predicted kinase
MYAEGNASTTLTFKELCLLALNMTEDHFQARCQLSLNPKYTYICELVSPDNPIVVKYTTHQIHLLSVRENATGNYILDENPDFLKRLKPIHFDSLADCLYVLNSKPVLFEGYVFYKDSVPVYKLKSKQYLSFAGIKGASDSEKVRLVLENGLYEYLQKYPEDEYKFELIHEGIKYIKFDMQTKYLEEYASIEEDKEFAKAIFGWDYQHLAYTARKQGVSFEEAFNKQTMSYRIKIVKKAMDHINRTQGLAASEAKKNLPTSEESMEVEQTVPEVPTKQFKPTPKMKICVGISGAGKSTLAKKLVENEGYVEISRDNFREQLFGQNYKFTKQNEKIIEDKVEKYWQELLLTRPNVIVSDTNLNPKYRQLWIDRAHANGYLSELVPLEITLEEAYKRNLKRGYKALDTNVLNNQYAKWLDFQRSQKKFPPVYSPKINAPKIIICDIDGTVCEMEGRGPFEWDKVHTDKPREQVIKMISAYVRQEDLQIAFVSGRSGQCQQLTLEWLEKHLPFDVFKKIIGLYMRGKDQLYTNDKVHKQKIFFDFLSENYNVVAAFDDRPKIVRLWKDLGIQNVISVQKDYNEF